jgi:xanthine dehydrogenase accessory factor
MNIYTFLSEQIENHNKVMLLLVVSSTGSSPGRQGFKMAVGTDGEIFGSVGGGIMEYNLVEEAKAYLKKSDFSPFLKQQVHKGGVADGSGLICSGEQMVLFYLLDSGVQHHLNNILSQKKGSLKVTPEKFELLPSFSSSNKYQFEFESKNSWTYIENINPNNQLYIIGAGHVGLATSEIFSKLNFEITMIDDRKDLNTLINNPFIDNKIITNYENIDQFIPDGKNTFVAIMTQGFKTDKIVLKKLILKKIKYLGMMGSKTKLKTMFEVLEKEGVSKKLLQKIHAPIGLAIGSKTPMEIAVSVAGEVIDIRNM